MIWWDRCDRNGIFMGMEEIIMYKEVEDIMMWIPEHMIMEWIEDLLSPDCVERVHAHGEISDKA